jgi:PRC-barrel domain
VDLGNPISYLALEPGTPVFSADGLEIGRVAEVVADTDADIFDGLILDLGGDGRRFIEGERVIAMHERGVVLTVDAEEARQLPVP